LFGLGRVRVTVSLSPPTVMGHVLSFRNP
jgi:hypothetical protein